MVLGLCAGHWCWVGEAGYGALAVHGGARERDESNGRSERTLEADID